MPEAVRGVQWRLSHAASSITGQPAMRFPIINHQEIAMIKLALFARLEAKPGKEAAVAAFLEKGLAMAREETTTPIWFALRLSPTTFGIFDAFENEAGREAHLTGPIAQALMANAAELLAAPPSIEKIEVLGLKNSH